MEGWLKRLLTDDLGLKAASVFLGVGIWYGVHQVTLGEITLPEVPVEASAPAGTGWAVRVFPPIVRLKVSGPKHLVERLQDRPVTVRIPIPENVAPDGARRRILVEPAYLLPRVKGITLESRPAEVTLSVDEQAEQTFQVVADVADPPPGFAIEEIIVNPRTVTVRGPKSFLETAQSRGTTLRTTRVDPGYQSEGNFPFSGTEVRAELRVDDQALPVEVVPEAVTVLVAVSQSREHRRIEKIPLQRLVNPLGAARTVTIPPEISISVKGPKMVKLPDGGERLFHDLKPEDILAFVKIPDGLSPGIHPAIPVIVRLPEGVSLDQAPPTVQVEIK